MYLLYILSLLFCFSLGIADEQPLDESSDEPFGTLLVSYSTGEKAERLDRIRFSLISDSMEELYPQGDAFVESIDLQSRMIVIENLPEGLYKLKFLIPNTDHLFAEIPEKEIKIIKNKVVRIDQLIRPDDSIPQEKTEPLQTQVADSYIQRRPSGTVIINQINAQLTVTNNQPQARWSLFRNDVNVYEGVGSVTNLQVLDGDYYRIVPEPLEGYVVRISPSSFSLYPAQTVRVSIAYEKTIGSMFLQTSFPAGETLTLTLKKDHAPPETIRLPSKGGNIYWQSKPLQAGIYEISYELPDNFEKIPPEKMLLKNGQRIQLSPKFAAKSGVHVMANISEAVFLLNSMNGASIWKGSGREYTFLNIPQGMYRLTFSTENTDYFIPPKEMKFSFNGKETKEINATFQIAGKITIKTNIDRSQAVIQEIGGSQKTYRESILNHFKSFVLPEGKYKITLSTFSEDRDKTAGMQAPDPVEITVRPLSSEDLNLSFHIGGAASEKQRKLIVSSGISAAGFNLYKINQEGKELVGHYSGKNIQLTLPSADLYEIVYDAVPNYKTPENATIEIKAGEEKTIQGGYTSIQSFVDIPAGRMILGDPSSTEKINDLSTKTVSLAPFSIGVYVVTNGEYAEWLNNAIKTGSISYIKEADQRGQVVNMKNQLLLKTFEADPYSQISAQLQSTDIPFFMPLAGKDSYPLINVSWYGAKEFCKDNSCRLPTEAEWEKAAGMEPEVKDQPLKKFIYGFGRNDIDPTWANYKDNIDTIQHFKVLTTPVGFYNGINYLPLSLNMKSQKQTHLAKSPYGAFDMSGNVWEWTSDWYGDAYETTAAKTDPKGPSEGTQKVVKGGCYDSLSDGVRVFERMGLPPDYCDAYTGFRVAK